MRSRSMDEDYEEKGLESEETLMDIKPRKSKSKSKNTKSKLEAKMGRLKKPPPQKDFQYFVKIRLNGTMNNLHRLIARCEVSNEKLVEIYGKTTSHSSFWYTKCCDPAIKSKVEHIWPLCYGKAKVPSSKLIAKEFALGIVLEKKFSKDVSWVAFVEETNSNQHSKFFKQLEKMHNQRKYMKGLNGVLVKCEPQLEGESDSKATKYEIV